MRTMKMQDSYFRMSVGRASRTEHKAHAKALRQREVCLMFRNLCSAPQALAKSGFLSL